MSNEARWCREKREDHKGRSKKIEATWVAGRRSRPRTEGLEEGIGSVPMDGSDDRWRSIEEGIGCMPMDVSMIDTMETRRTLVVQSTRRRLDRRVNKKWRPIRLQRGSRKKNGTVATSATQQEEFPAVCRCRLELGARRGRQDASQ